MPYDGRRMRRGRVERDYFCWECARCVRADGVSAHCELYGFMPSMACAVDGERREDACAGYRKVKR